MARLAALDEVEPLHGPVLLARVDGRPVAAYSRADGRVAADPFVRSADAVAMLRRFAGSAPRGRLGLGRGSLGLAA